MLAACSNGKIPLAYNFEEGEGTRYHWIIDSRTSVNSTSEQSVTTTNMVVDVHEQVSRGDEPMLTITLKPTSLKQDGRPMKTPATTTVKYQLNDRGEIVKAATKELAGPAASAVQLGATLIRSRIALPADPVGIGDEWDTPLVLDGDLGNINLEGRGKLLGFELKGKRKLARIETTRTGDIVTHQQQGGLPVRLRGTSTTNAMSSLDVESGVLYSSSARLISDFDIASQESGKLIGTMRVTLNSSLKLAPQPA
ncbi:hypothetical protein BH23ACT12_BH23ACT12_13270 [soil metagenome]